MPEQLLFPAFAMFFLTISCIFSMGLMRFNAIKKGDVKISYYREYNKGQQPSKLHIIGRHVQNHFEVPPIFYAGVIIAYLIGVESLWSITFAWAFVVARCVHTFIHLGTNNVSQRFFVFGFSLLMLTALWVSILLELLAR
jgi:hypothetical protein